MSITKLSNARLKFHADKKFPHGRFTSKEIDSEHKRRAKSEPNYHKVKPKVEMKTFSEIRDHLAEKYHTVTRVKESVDESYNFSDDEVHAICVLEGVESLDELSSDKLDDYRQRAFKDQPANSKDNPDKHRRRSKGRALAFAKVTNRAKVNATKTEDHLAELSNKTLKNYKDVAKDNFNELGHNSLGNKKQRTKGSDTHTRMSKRAAGARLAHRKILNKLSNKETN